MRTEDLKEKINWLPEPERKITLNELASIEKRLLEIDLICEIFKRRVDEMPKKGIM